MPPTAKTNQHLAREVGPATVWDQVNGLKVLIYGESGSGKTSCASTFPGPTLWLICSGGSRPGELRSIDTPANRKKITPKIITSTTVLREQLAGISNFATIVLDHASGFADLVLKEILGIEEIPAQKGWGLASQKEYGQQAAQCKEYFRSLLNFSGNVVIIAQQRTFGGKEDGIDPEIIRPTIGPALTPSLAGWICPAVDFLVQTYKAPKMTEVRTKIAGQEHLRMERTKGVNYCLRTGPHDIFMTKFRVTREIILPEFIVDPDYEKILAVIRGEGEDNG